MNLSTSPASQLAYVLVFHGSRDVRSQQAAQILTQRFSQQMQSFNGPTVPSPQVQAAFLECQPLTLAEQIEQFVHQLLPSVQQTDLLHPPVRLVVVPVFLLAGVHLMEDIPVQIAAVQAKIAASATLMLTRHLGSHPDLPHLIAARMAAISAESWILLTHGSRRPGANQPITALADAVGATAAYWSVPPHVETCLTNLQQSGIRQIGIFPYILFQGGITDAIAQTVAQCSTQFPDLQLTLLDTLDASPQLVNLLVDLATDPLKTK